MNEHDDQDISEEDKALLGIEDSPITPTDSVQDALNPLSNTDDLLDPGHNPFLDSILDDHKARVTLRREDSDPFITPNNIPREELVKQIQEEMAEPDSIVRDDRAFTRIVDLSLVQLQDRLLYGDILPGKYGGFSRVPLSAPALAAILKLGVESRDTARRQKQNSTEEANELLYELVNRLKALAPSKDQMALRVIDAELADDPTTTKLLKK